MTKSENFIFRTTPCIKQMLEDLAKTNGTSKAKMIEGLIVSAHKQNAPIEREVAK